MAPNYLLANSVGQWHINPLNFLLRADYLLWSFIFFKLIPNF